MRPLNLLVASALLVIVAACRAAPAPQAPVQPTPAAPAPSASAATTATPAPPRTGAVAQLDHSCRTDADCTVKNVGNCCGAFPACVNVASPTDPAAVAAQCRASGRMSVCGFKEISGCQCVAGQCTAKDASADTLRRPVETPEPIR